MKEQVDLEKQHLSDINDSLSHIDTTRETLPKEKIKVESGGTVDLASTTVKVLVGRLA